MLLSICVLVVGVNGALHSQIPSSYDSNVILEIVNRHFTVGKRIPSLYLRLFSDGTVECSTIKFGKHDVATTRKERLKPEELAQVTSILNDPSLRGSAHDYALQRVVFDSWMEWDITINRPSPSLPPQNITLSFAGGSGDSKLPRALTRLGCQILELRRRTYGDDEAYYKPACTGS
jgi:hypothetical protein